MAHNKGRGVKKNLQLKTVETLSLTQQIENILKTKEDIDTKPDYIKRLYLIDLFQTLRNVASWNYHHCTLSSADKQTIDDSLGTIEELVQLAYIIIQQLKGESFNGNN